MKNSVVMMMLVDSRTAGGEGWASDPNSVFALPLKREMLRRFAAESNVAGEVILELERDSNLEFLIDAAVYQLGMLDAQSVVSLDRSGLQEVGIYDALCHRLLESGIDMMEPANYDLLTLRPIAAEPTVR